MKPFRQTFWSSHTGADTRQLIIQQSLSRPDRGTESENVLWEAAMSRNFIDENMEKLMELESVIQYTFQDKRKLLLAITHSSFANEKRNEGLISNERLEFLGDAILNIVTSENIYVHFHSMPEGEMTKTRAAIVCESSLVKCADRIHLGEFLLLGKGEENTGGRNRPSILCDAFEALIGAIYLDGGLEEAKRFILKMLADMFQDVQKNLVFVDYKTQFQEMIQKQSDQRINYRILEEKGPDHSKVFVAQVSVGDRSLGNGEGKSKKEAEQNAAKTALDRFCEK